MLYTHDHKLQKKQQKKQAHAFYEVPLLAYAYYGPGQDHCLNLGYTQDKIADYFAINLHRSSFCREFNVFWSTVQGFRN